MGQGEEDDAKPQLINREVERAELQWVSPRLLRFRFSLERGERAEHALETGQAVNIHKSETVR